MFGLTSVMLVITILGDLRVGSQRLHGNEARLCDQATFFFDNSNLWNAHFGGRFVAVDAA